MNKQFVVFILLLFTISFAYAQNKTVIKGIVVDAINNEPLPFANVIFNELMTGTVTDSIGKYQMQTDQHVTKISVTYLGYKPDTLAIQQGKSQTLNFKLYPASTDLKEMVFTAKKVDYKNKENPAVELIKRVVEHKSLNIIEGFDYYECEKYAKIIFGVSNLSEKLKNGKFMRKVNFIFKNMDTVKIPGKEMLPIYINEQLSDYYFRKTPEIRKEVVKATKRINYAGFIDNEGLTYYLNYIYQNINIYDENISLFTNLFVSPISSLAPTMYRFYIMDTLLIGKDSCIKLSFFPRNKGDMLFQGYLFITKDSLYAVKKIDMTVNKDINLNWVSGLRIIQSYEKNNTKGWALTEDYINADFGVGKDNLELYGEKSISYKNNLFNSARPNEFYEGEAYSTKEDANDKPEEFWTHSRHHRLTNTENGIYAMMDSVSKVGVYRRDMALIEWLTSGYPNLGLVEIGSVNTFYSYNPVEGNRVKFGGRTTPDLSNKIFLDGYAAYGFRDMKYKYVASLTYSLTKKNIYQFPVKTFKFEVDKDLKIPGQGLKRDNENDVLLNFKRGANDKWFYVNSYFFEFLNEFKNHFSFNLTLKNTTYAPAGSLYFATYDAAKNITTSIKDIQNTSASLNLRYAPKERFYQGKVFRFPIVSLLPVFRVEFTAGLKNLTHQGYDYQKIYASISKRFSFAPVGYTDVLLEGGQLFGQLPYPLLILPRANQTYSYQPTSYNLMNFMEFMNDRVAAISIDHYFDGFLLNRVPLLKQLKLREIFMFKAMQGSLSTQNNPAYRPELPVFPVAGNGQPITYTLTKEPYMEIGFGIGNILKVLRVDFLERLNYLNNLNVSKYGVRFEVKIDF
ncbi:MAG: DUF5686 family protein [Bacteroidota bacterium]